MFSFEKLEVWQDAMKLTCRIYKLTEQFPPSEKFLLIDQIRRASSSLCANIAERNTRQTGKDKAYFTTIAYGSLMETFNHLILAEKLNYITYEELEIIRKIIEKLSHQLNHYVSTNNLHLPYNQQSANQERLSGNCQSGEAAKLKKIST